MPVLNRVAFVHKSDNSKSSEFDSEHDAHATGTPMIVEAKLDTALLLIACLVVNPNHLLQRRPSITMTGTSNTAIAGNVIKIIGMPMSASNGNGTKE